MSRSRDIANLLGAGSVILDGAPSALDTLNELAAAIGDDSNYASTVTTALNNRVLKTGGDTIIVSSGTTVPLTIQNNGTGNSFVVNDEGSDTTPFVIDASGNVGIATVSPSSDFKLDINGGSRSLIVTNAQNASYTLVLTDAGKVIEMNNAAANTLTVPTNSVVAFPIGTVIDIFQTGAGQTTVGGAGVTINARPGLKLSGQWATATLIKRATDTWLLTGSLSA